MNEETATQQEGVLTEGAQPNVAPEADLSFREHVRWRTTGELPAKSDPQQPAAAGTPPVEEPPAKTEPEPGTAEPQQEEEEEEEPEEPVAHRRNGRQRRIDRLTRENEQLKQQLAAAAQPPPRPAAGPPGKPELQNFDTLEAYQEALTDWHFTQREERRQAEAAAKAAQETQEKLQTEWDSRQKTARKAHPDYDDVIEATAAPEGPGVVAARQAMLEDPAGAEILYHLATHPEDLKRIAALQPIAAVREIGRLSAILLPPSPTANGKQRLTAAPKPPPPNSRPAKTASDSIFDPAVQGDFRRYAKARAAMKDK